MNKIYLSSAALLCAFAMSALDFESYKPAKSEKTLFSCGFETPNIPGSNIRKGCAIVSTKISVQSESDRISSNARQEAMRNKPHRLNLLRSASRYFFPARSRTFISRLAWCS